MTSRTLSIHSKSLDNMISTISNSLSIQKNISHSDVMISRSCSSSTQKDESFFDIMKSNSCSPNTNPASSSSITVTDFDSCSQSTNHALSSSIIATDSDSCSSIMNHVSSSSIIVTDSKPHPSSPKKIRMTNPCASAFFRRSQLKTHYQTSSSIYDQTHRERGSSFARIHQFNFRRESQHHRLFISRIHSSRYLESREERVIRDP